MATNIPVDRPMPLGYSFLQNAAHVTSPLDNRCGSKQFRDSFNMGTVLLSQMNAGQSGKIEELSGQGDVYQRLLEMGITKGVDVEVVRFAPMGDPIDIKIRGYHLSLRRQEADIVKVQLND